jgi:hypothetical protein
MNIFTSYDFTNTALSSATKEYGAFNEALKRFDVSASSAEMAMTVPWCFWMSAYRSRYAVSSRVQPGVKAFGKKASTTGPRSTSF